MPIVDTRDLHLMQRLQNTAVEVKKMLDVKEWKRFFKRKAEDLEFDRTRSAAQVATQKDMGNRVRSQVAKNRNAGNVGRHTVKRKQVTAAGPKLNKRVTPQKWRNALQGKLKWKNSTWTTRALQIGLSIAAWNLGTSAFQSTTRAFSKPAIPKEYERGYDIIQENLTDFGSPVRLDKASAKGIAPYYSTVRKARMTTVDSTIRKNIAFLQHKNAIGHTRY